MEILIALGSINAFFFSLVIFGKRSRTKADRLLAILFVVLGLSFGMVYFSYILELPVLQLFIWNMGLLITPLLYLYAYQLLNGITKFKKTYLLNFIPYVVSWVYLALLLIFYSETEIRNLFNSSLTDTSVLFVFFTIIEILVIPFYIVLIVRLLRNLSSVQPNPNSTHLSFRRNKAKHEHCDWRNLLGKWLFFKRFLCFQLSFLKLSGRNDTSRGLCDNKTLVWLKVLIISISLIWLLIVSFYYLSPLSSEMGLKYGFGLSSIIVFFLGYIIQSKRLFIEK